MYLKKSKNSKTGKTYLYIADRYYDREKGYTKTITVKSLGYLNVLKKQYKVSEFKIDNIMKLLVFARCLFPDSKKSTYENKNLFFNNTDFSLKEVYNALDYLDPFKETIQHFIYDHIEEQYKQKNKIVFYDVTNYYFEILDEDKIAKEEKLDGYYMIVSSKFEKTPDEIIDIYK